jgi:hypothetical protein
MAYLNLILTAILLAIWIIVLVIVIKLDQSRSESLKLINSIIQDVKVVKEDFKVIKSSLNKY